MQSAAVLQRHLLIRRDPALSPYLWRGLLPALGLTLLVAFALGPVARNWIQGAIAGGIRSQLDAAGFTWVSLTASGQEVRLTGVAPSSAIAERALALARSASCPTWTGPRTCASQVSTAFSLAPPPAPVEPAAAVPLAASPGAPTAAHSAALCERSLAALLVGDEIRFARDSAAISPRSGPLLDRIATQIGACPGSIRIEGYTDSAGRPTANRALSRARAEAVRAALIARGVAGTRLEAHGYGSARPLVSNHTARGRARNRRIEFHALAARSA